MKLEEAKKLQIMFESYLKCKCRWKCKEERNNSEEQKSALENIKLLYKSQDTVIKSFNDYSWIIFGAKCKASHGKGIPSMLARVDCVAKFFNRKESDHSNLKTLSPKQMLQRLKIALPQVKAGNTYENLLNEIIAIIYFLNWAK